MSATARHPTAQLDADAFREAVSRLPAAVAAGRWSERATTSLAGARLGIAGIGHIGRERARMTHAAFGTEILYWNRTSRPEPAALPYTTEHLEALGPSGYLVNCSRAELIDPVALRSALAEGTIAGASIDGYYTEPTPAPADDPHGLLAFAPNRLLVTRTAASTAPRRWPGWPRWRWRTCSLWGGGRTRRMP
ncbi:NAD(P)-dependent oxidoreductase [Streptomyces griseorubiginosus]|uniref:NAD(P)-dependent oxidoreductase n=1 Tax=Streptomyces griseorubiginosus TaxID=67304 RepID=UPI0036E4FEAE